MKKLDPQFKIRLPEDLKSRLEAKAVAAERSLTAEIVQRLSESLTKEAAETAALGAFMKEMSEIVQSLHDFKNSLPAKPSGLLGVDVKQFLAERDALDEKARQSKENVERDVEKAAERLGMQRPRKPAKSK